VRQWPAQTLLTDGRGAQLGPWALERAMRTARPKVAGLADGFRYHDLRHYLASLLIAEGSDVKTVQARLRHASAKTALDTHGHLWPTGTSPHGPRSRPFSRLMRTPCGLRRPGDDVAAGQLRQDAYASK
jgi:Phage integrase family